MSGRMHLAGLAVGALCALNAVAGGQFEGVGLAPGELHAVYLRLMQAGIDDAAERALVAYLTKEPQQDPLAWIDLARFQFRGKRVEEARRSFLIGLQMDQKSVNALLQQEQKSGRRELLEIAEPFLKPRQSRQPKL